MDTTEARAAALAAAVLVHTSAPRRHIESETRLEAEIEATAARFAAWLSPTTELQLTASVITNQSTGQQTGPAPAGDNVQITDTDEFTVTVETDDSKGAPTADQLTWTVDNDTVVTLTPSADSKSCLITAGVPGSAVVTVTDSSVTPALSATEAVDVVAGGTTTIKLTEGPVSPQTPPASS